MWNKYSIPDIELLLCLICEMLSDYLYHFTFHYLQFYFRDLYILLFICLRMGYIIENQSLT